MKFIYITWIIRRWTIAYNQPKWFILNKKLVKTLFDKKGNNKTREKEWLKREMGGKNENWTKK